MAQLLTSTGQIDLRPMGDRAWLVRWRAGERDNQHLDLPSAVKYEQMLAARWLATRLQQAVPEKDGWPLEFVPGYDSVLVPFDPVRVPPAEVKNWLEGQISLALAAWQGSSQVEGPVTRRHRLPVLYGGADGPDLEAVALRNGLTPAEVIKLHTGTVYSVYLVGFAPGFAYLGALPPGLDAPRLSSPRPRVKAGTVALAAGLTGVYPLAMPGGWNLIGYTPFSLFDAAQEPPVRFLPGDSVQFYSVEAAALPALTLAGRSLAPGEGVE